MYDEKPAASASVAAVPETTADGTIVVPEYDSAAVADPLEGGGEGGSAELSSGHGPWKKFVFASSLISP